MPEKPEHHEEDNLWVGEQIRIYRKKAGLTQMALADKVGDVGYQKYISDYEHGIDHMPIPVFFAIIEALHVSPSDILPPRLYGKNRNVFDEYLSLNEEHREAVRLLIQSLLKAEGKDKRFPNER